MDYLEYVCKLVPWLGDIQPGGGPPIAHPPQFTNTAVTAKDVVPRMLRGGATAIYTAETS